MVDGEAQDPEGVKYVPGGQGRGVVEISFLAHVPSNCLIVPNGHAGIGVGVGAEQIPDAVRYVPGGQGRGVDISTLMQLPSYFLSVPNGHGGLGVVVGLKHLPVPVE